MNTSARIRTVAVIGAGKAGRGFALACAAAGLHVILEDVMPSNLRQAASVVAEQNLSAQVQLASTVEDAVHAADLAIDFVPDELESKLEIFSLLDRMAPPRTVLLTPTEHISITDLASCTYRPQRCFGLRGLGQNESFRLLHPTDFDSEALTATEEFLHQIGHTAAIELDPDLPMLMKNIVYTR